MGKYTAEKVLNLNVKKRWYVVANRIEATIYKDANDQRFIFVERLPNEDGHLTETSLDADKSGRSGSGSRSGSVHHSLDRHSKQHEQVARKFAQKIIKKLSTCVESTAEHDVKSELVIVAEPHFLGLLRATIPAAMKGLITHEIRRDYSGLNASELRAQIMQVIEKE